MRARQALRVAQEQKVIVERKLDDIHGQMDDMARAVYTRGPLAEIEVILDASSPGDFQARLASVDTVSRMQAGVQQSLTQTEADLVMQGVRLEALRLEAEAEDAKAERALAEARVALRKARDKQEKVSALRKERRAALGQAQAFKSKVKKRYDNLLAEQQRLAAAARKAATALRTAARSCCTCSRRSLRRQR